MNVSIVVPVYNVELYLRKCIDSILLQTYKNLDVILVDDGSTDASGKICDEYEKKYDNIRVIHKENGGLSSARNTGLKNAKGEYVYFLDSDDWIEPYCIEMLVSMAEENDLDAVLFDARVVDEEGIDILEPYYCMRYNRIGHYSGIYSGNEIFSKMIQNREYYSSVPLLFMRTKSIKNEFQPILHEDELFTIQYLYAVKRVAYMPELFYVRRVRRGSIMNVPKSTKHYLGMCKVIEEILKIDNKDKSIIRYVCTLFQCTEQIFHRLGREEKKSVKNKKRELIQLFRASNYWENRRLRITTQFIWIYPYYAKLQRIENIWVESVLRRLEEYPKNIRKMQQIKMQMSDKNIYILGGPVHGNLGDHAIAIAQEKLLKELFRDKTILEIEMPLYRRNKKKIQKLIKENDIIVIPGGGWLGNQWYHNEIMVEDVINRFPKNRIVILPQTIYYESSKDKNKQIKQSIKVVNGHNSLLLFLRDQLSHKFAQENYSIKSIYAPDLVLMLDYMYTDVVRDGVIFCMRDDCEKAIPKQEEEIFIESIKGLYDHYKYTTTVIGNVPVEKRKNAVNKKLKEFSHAELIITDRLHAMLFAAITGTSCIAFDNTSKKVSGVYEWIKHLEYVKIVSSFEEAKEEVKNMLENKGIKNIYKKPSFEKLKEEIMKFLD